VTFAKFVEEEEAEGTTRRMDTQQLKLKQMRKKLTRIHDQNYHQDLVDQQYLMVMHGVAIWLTMPTMPMLTPTLLWCNH
jgi:hypothetical protein